MTDRIVSVNLGQRGYDIHVGSGLTARAGALIAPLLARPQVVIVTDENVAPRRLAPLQAALDTAGIGHDAIILPPGEGQKSFAGLERLCDALLTRKVERRDKVIALGGGVIGDLVGFACSILRRGTDFIQIPTTLLAQVDSSVGGKTAINVKYGKNLLGAFHQPRLVLADVDALDSLPPRELRAGYAEVVKYGLLGDADFFAWLEQHGEALLAGDTALRIEAVARCCAHKARIVMADEREEGERALLNLGHTFGHALEAETGYSARLLHGEGVAVGMALAFKLSAKLGLCDAALPARVIAHLRRCAMPAGIGDVDGAAGFDAEILLAHMGQDKKVRAGQLVFILAEAIGRAVIRDDVSKDAVLALLNEELAAIAGPGPVPGHNTLRKAR